MGHAASLQRTEAESGMEISVKLQAAELLQVSPARGLCFLFWSHSQGCSGLTPGSTFRDTLLAGFSGPYVVPGIELRLVACKATCFSDSMGNICIWQGCVLVREKLGKDYLRSQGQATWILVPTEHLQACQL